MEQEKTERARLRDVNAEAIHSFEQVRSQVDQLVESLDIKGLSKKIETFGKERPVAMALTALTVGLAVGLVVRKQGGV